MQSLGGVLWKLYSKKILQNSQENICADVSFWIKLQASSLMKLYWKRIRDRCFPETFEKFLIATFLQNYIFYI